MVQAFDLVLAAGGEDDFAGFRKQKGRAFSDAPLAPPKDLALKTLADIDFRARPASG